jgi:hypothetical protein
MAELFFESFRKKSTGRLKAGVSLRKKSTGSLKAGKALTDSPIVTRYNNKTYHILIVLMGLSEES